MTTKWVIALSVFIFSAARVALTQQQTTLNIQDGQTIRLWSGAAPGALGMETEIFL